VNIVPIYYILIILMNFSGILYDLRYINNQLVMFNQHKDNINIVACLFLIMGTIYLRSRANNALSMRNNIYLRVP
jgi:hypothetical protein